MTKPNHGLRTTGTHTGNFGRAKVQGKRGELDLTKEILNRDNLRIPTRQEAQARLEEAFEKTTDPKLKRFLAEELRSHQLILTLILEDASAIAELHTMWESGILPTTTSIEYADLLARFNENRSG